MKLILNNKIKTVSDRLSEFKGKVDSELVDKINEARSNLEVFQSNIFKKLKSAHTDLSQEYTSQKLEGALLRYASLLAAYDLPHKVMKKLNSLCEDFLDVCDNSEYKKHEVDSCMANIQDLLQRIEEINWDKLPESVDMNSIFEAINKLEISNVEFLPKYSFRDFAFAYQRCGLKGIYYALPLLLKAEIPTDTNIEEILPDNPTPTTQHNS